MKSHLNLLPIADQRRRLIRERVQTWCAVWLAAAAVAAGGVWLDFSRDRAQRARLSDLERRHTPLNELQTQTRSIERQIRDLRERENLALQVAEERPLATLLGLLSRAAKAGDGNVCVQKMLLEPAAENRQAGIANRAARSVLLLEGVGVDNATVARFAAELRAAGVFAQVRLRSSNSSEVGGKPAVSYKLECLL